MKYLILFLLALITLTAYAEIYKTVDANGNIIFSDKPASNNSVPIELPKANTALSTPSASPNTSLPMNAPPDSGPGDGNGNGNQVYKKFIISSPADQETIQNQPTISIKIDIQPDLHAGDVIQIYLDGTPWGSALPVTTFDMTAPDRGTHVISATLFDHSMRALKQSNSNTIYVHHTHV